MKCHCDACNYTFEASVFHSKYEIPKKCPKCRKITVSKGVPAVRTATEEEAAEYMNLQLEIMEAAYKGLTVEENRENDGGDNVITFPGSHDY